MLGSCSQFCITSNGQCILLFLVAGEKHAGTQVFTWKLLPRWCQVFLLVHTFDLHIQDHVEQLWKLLRRLPGVKLWSAGEKKTDGNGENKPVNIFFISTLSWDSMVQRAYFVIMVKKRSHLLNFNTVVPGAMKPVWNWIWKIWVLDTWQKQKKDRIFFFFFAKSNFILWCKK